MNAEKFLSSLTENTRKAYESDLSAFFSFLGDNTISPKTLLEFQASQLQGLSPSTVSRRVAAIRSFIRWQEISEELPTGTFASITVVRGPKKPQQVKDALTDEEVSALLNSFPLTEFQGARDYAAILLALDTGMRVSELVSTQIENCHFDARGGYMTVEGKGRKQRRVFWGVEASSALVSYLSLRGNPVSGPVFVSARGTVLTPRHYQKLLSEKSDELGFEIHPHKLRRTMAVRTLDATGNLRAVADLLGHESIITTQLYTPMATSRLRDIADAGRVDSTLETCYTAEKERIRK